jgi:transposase-like protein
MFLNRLAFGDNISCPSCQRKLADSYKNKYLWCKYCRKKYRPTAYRGSWLYGMKLSSRQLFVLLWCWQNKKSPDTARLLSGVSYTTINRWYQKFRDKIPPDQLSKLSVSVQIDESYFGRLKSKQPQTIVTGAIANNGQVILEITNSRSQEVLEDFVLTNIAENSFISTDKWYGYNDLDFFGYEHQTWNHSLGFLAGTNQIEGLWSRIKRYLRKLYGCVQTTHLEDVLKEWQARHNQKELFSSPEYFLQRTLTT